MTGAVAIPWIPGASIDRDGNVYRNGKPKKLSVGKNGYPQVVFSINNKSHTYTIHRLLLRVFVGEPKEGQECLHINGNKLDYRLENLRWGTRAENMADAVKHGTATVGSKNTQAKLTEDDIWWLVRLRATGFTHKEIAQKFNVSINTAIRAATGITYKGERQNDPVR